MEYQIRRSLKRSISFNSAVDVWSRGILGRIQATLGRQKANRLKAIESTINGDDQCWEEVHGQSSAFALLGRRPRMEDRYIIEENINKSTGIAFFAIFDGHGGEFAADFAKDILVKNIYNKIIETTKLLKGQQQLHAAGGSAADSDYTGYGASPYLKRRESRKDDPNKENTEPAVVQRRDSLRKAHSTADDCSTGSKQKSTSASGGLQKDADVFTSKLNSLMRGNAPAKDTSFFSGGGGGGSSNNNRDSGSNSGGPPPSFDAKCYIDNGKINFGKLITDEVLSADYKLVEAAKKATNIAGTTALIAILQDSRLIVANVGDSRGVMCDARGIAIPLSFDHKPQQVRERKRIHDAGGFIAFRGVWRVAGILATSRALGDYPLKEKHLVIANPDILTFDLNDHKPSFLILASDGLWDTFSNEEACSYIKAHIAEPDFGAKSLTVQSYQRGSVDNITVLVIVFRNGSYRIGQSTGGPGAAPGVPVAGPATKVAGTQAGTPADTPPPTAAVRRSNSGVTAK